MSRPPPIYTRTDPLFPYTPLVRSLELYASVADHGRDRGADADLCRCPLRPAGGGRLAPVAGERGGSGRHADWLMPSAASGAAAPSSSRSEEQTSELQSLMRISYAVLCLKKKNISNTH